MSVGDGIGRTEIADLLTAVAAVRRALARPEIPSDSPAAHFLELAVAEREGWIAEQVVIVADLWTLVAAEQAKGAGTLIRDGEHAFSLFPLCRSIIEHSCSVIWVLDPDPAISPEVRCARAALGVLRSQEELTKAAARLGGKTSDTYKAKKKELDDLRHRISQAFPQDTDPLSYVIAGQKQARPTEVIAHFGERWGGEARTWEGIYDYMCAVGTHPSLAAFEFFASGPDGTHDIEMSLDFLGRLVRTALATLLKALEHYAVYCAWDLTDLDELIDRANVVFPDLLPGPPTSAGISQGG